MMAIGIVLIFLAFFVGAYALLMRIHAKHIQTDFRLSSLAEESIEKDSKWIYGWIRFVPQSQKQAKKAMLQKAGFLSHMSFEQWLFRYHMLRIILLMLLGLFIYALGGGFKQYLVSLALIGFTTFVVFRFLLAKAISKRRMRLIKDLPFSLDLITLSVEAGLSLDGAISKIVETIEGPLSDEFAQTLKEIRMGFDKKMALKNMAIRSDIPAISTLMSALIQAEEMGVGLGTVLRIEGAQIREKQKQAAKEKAMKAPVKMLFPLVFFIFPAIFVIILGPAVLQIISIF